MRSTSLALLAGAASLVQAGPFRRSAAQPVQEDDSSSYGVAAYWGIENNEQDLASYCQDGEGVDYVILDFLSQFGNGEYPNSGVSGIGGCFIQSDQSFSGACSQVGEDITTCQSLGKKVFLSVGGGAAQFQINGDGDADGIAYSLWNSYANPDVVASGTPRPFGNATVDGWDFDIESDPSNSSNYLGELVNKLRNYFSSDTSRSYYISGAPECPFDPNSGDIYYMGSSIMAAQYDYLWIQFYNNACGANNLFDGNKVGTYNFNDWPAKLSGGASANAKLFVGLPGSTTAADHDYDFVDPSNLASLLDQSKGVAGFAGFMVFDAGASDTSTSNGCTYAQNLNSTLATGSPC